MPLDQESVGILERMLERARKPRAPFEPGESDELRDRMNRAGVPERERKLLLADAGGERLFTTTALEAVKDEVPSLLVLAGARGVGKTLAACWALRELGGSYLTAYQFARPGLDLEALKGKRCVVVDQLGRENVSASDFCLSQLEELIDARYANRRLTILVANLTREQFVARYGGIIDDRLEGDGKFVVCLGASLRRDK
jgi:DNA replication protein DnaC